METLHDRLRRSLKGRAWLEVRRDGRTIRHTPVTSNVVTDLGLTFLFWALFVTPNNIGGGQLNSANYPFLAAGNNYFDGPSFAPTNIGNVIYYDGTYYLPAWSNPFSMLYASTDTTTPSSSTNVLPGGTLIALAPAINSQGTSLGWIAPSGQSTSGGGGSFTSVIGTSPSVSVQTAISTLASIPFVPYAGSGTVTVGSVGFTNGLYASTSSTTSWTGIDATAVAIAGSTTPASTKNLSIGTKLIPSTTLSVTNGEQLVVNYEISFTPA